MTRAVLSLGSNLGDRAARLRAAVRGLGAAVIAVSGVYETPPWGDQDQPAYLNAVALVHDVDADPWTWLGLAQRLEGEAGRARDPRRHFGPRTLDVDVIAVWADDGTPLTADHPELTLPHPRAHLRAFVVRPWLDIEPYAQLPGHGFVHDLVRSEPVASDLRDLRARDDISLETGPSVETEV
jgi:2-amino-4-hydroxy-6-hydroxymethyldihydropteridine diphosphokinase